MYKYIQQVLGSTLLAAGHTLATPSSRLHTFTFTLYVLYTQAELGRFLGGGGGGQGNETQFSFDIFLLKLKTPLEITFAA